MDNGHSGDMSDKPSRTWCVRYVSLKKICHISLQILLSISLISLQILLLICQISLQILLFIPNEKCHISLHTYSVIYPYRKYVIYPQRFCYLSLMEICHIYPQDSFYLSLTKVWHKSLQILLSIPNESMS